MTLHLLRIDALTQADAESLRETFPVRVAAARRFRREQDRRRSLAGTWLLREALGLEDETRLRYEERGKPCAAGSPPFSLSHSGDWALLAVGDCPLGADIERVDPRRVRALRRLCTPEEAAWAESDGEAPARWFQLWTWKEAVMKATGLGLALPPHGICVLPFAEGAGVEAAGARWFGGAAELEGYALGVCAARPITALDWKYHGRH